MPRRGRVPPRPWSVVNSKNLPDHEATVVDAEGNAIGVYNLATADFIVDCANRKWVKDALKTIPQRSWSNDPNMVRKMAARPNHKGRAFCK